MMKKLTSYLYFIAGVLFAITALIYSGSNKLMFGITYICLAATFISLGVAYRRRYK